MAVPFSGWVEDLVDVRLHQLSTSTTQTISTENQTFKSDLGISDDYIVWEQWDNSVRQWKIRKYDRQQSTVETLNVNSSNQESPSISGDNVIYVDDRLLPLHAKNVFTYNLVDESETQLSYRGAQIRPSRTDGHAVWGDGVSGANKVVLYDFSVLPRSKVSNYQDIFISGRLIMILQRWDETLEAWIDEETPVDRFVSVQRNNFAALESFWNTISTSASQPGRHRVFAEFTFDGTTIKSSWDFEVS